MIDPAAPGAPGWWDQLLSPDNVASLVIGIAIAAVAAWFAVKKYGREKENDRREARADIYAQALQAVQDYVELPYYVIRREDTPAGNVAVATRISETQSRLDFHRSWILIHAPEAVRGAYSALVDTARREAGRQISEAWNRPARNEAAEMPLGEKLPTPEYNAARDALRKMMRQDLS